METVIWKRFGSQDKAWLLLEQCVFYYSRETSHGCKLDPPRRQLQFNRRQLCGNKVHALLAHSDYIFHKKQVFSIADCFSMIIFWIILNDIILVPNRWLLSFARSRITNKIPSNNNIITRARILMTCHLSFLAR